MVMRTENLTILFSDIVGSTELSHRQSPDDADELRRRHFALLRKAITEAGGTEVKSLGDGLMVIFGSASAALGCAVAMQQAVEYDNRRRRHHPISLRTGLSGGEVIPDEHDYWGDPVVEAARLCALCDGGQILAADIVRLTAGRRSSHRYGLLGALNVEGPARTNRMRRGAVGSTWGRSSRFDDSHSGSLTGATRFRRYRPGDRALEDRRRTQVHHCWRLASGSPHLR